MDRERAVSDKNDHNVAGSGAPDEHDAQQNTYTNTNTLLHYCNYITSHHDKQTHTNINICKTFQTTHMQKKHVVGITVTVTVTGTVTLTWTAG